MRKIIFVCSGNTCRSPLALAAWRVLQQCGTAPSEVQAASAGIAASEGMPAAKYSVEIARLWGEDLSAHSSRLLRDEDVRSDALFFVMAPEHASALQAGFGVAAERIHLLGDFDPKRRGEILDPFGGSREAYETCATRIFRAVECVATAFKDGKL